MIYGPQRQRHGTTKNIVEGIGGVNDRKFSSIRFPIAIALF